jgi:osmotically-inducible protein OsmY
MLDEEPARGAWPGDWKAGEGLDEYGNQPAWMSGREGGYLQRHRPGGPHPGRGAKRYRRLDERIRQDIADRLAEHPDVDRSACEVRVQDGEVTLTGTVDQERTKQLIGEVAAQVPGVKHVHNRLRLRAGGAAVS